MNKSSSVVFRGAWGEVDLLRIALSRYGCWGCLVKTLNVNCSDAMLMAALSSGRFAPILGDGVIHFRTR